MICFGDVARHIIGKPVQQVIRAATCTNPLPTDIAKIVSRRFTFAVTLTQQSYYRQEKTYQVTSVVTSYGQHDPTPVAAPNGGCVAPDEDDGQTVRDAVHGGLPESGHDEPALSPSSVATTNHSSLLLLDAVSCILSYVLSVFLEFSTLVGFLSI